MDAGTQRVGVAIEIPGILRRASIDPAEVLQEVGLDAGALDQADNQIPYEVVGRLLEACGRRIGVESFGLILGQAVRPHHLGLVGELMMNAPTLGDAIMDLVGHHQRYVNGGIPYLFRSEEYAYWGYAIYLPDIVASNQIYDANIAAGCSLVRELTGISPAEVHLGHKPPQDAAAFRRFFGAPIRYNAESSVSHFRLEDLQRPIRGADPERRRALEARIAVYWQVEQPDFAAQVERLLRPRISGGTVTMAELMALVQLHERTISRRLALAGTSFRELLNRTRFCVAAEMLEFTALPVTQIALAFGYADTSVFSRSFRRWSGMSPTTWRMRKRMAACPPAGASSATPPRKGVALPLTEAYDN